MDLGAQFINAVAKPLQAPLERAPSKEDAA
jgi:hypothetical protein